MNEREQRARLEAAQGRISTLSSRNGVADARAEIEKNDLEISRFAPAIAIEQRRNEVLQRRIDLMRAQANGSERAALAQIVDKKGNSQGMITSLLGLIAGLGGMFFLSQTFGFPRHRVGFVCVGLAILLRAYGHWKLGKTGR
jgi:hypothetical protein